MNAARDLFAVCLPAGEARITMLVDNMGRSSEGSTLQRKGIFGPVYAGALAEKMSVASVQRATAPHSPSWQFLHYRHDAGPDSVCTSVEWTIDAAPGRAMFLALRELTHFAWIYWDGELLGEHHGDQALLDGFTASEFVLPSRDSVRNQLRIVFYGDADPDLARCVRFYSFARADALRDWEFRSWTAPGEPAADQQGGSEPCCWKAEFARPAVKPPLFFNTQGLSKGQVYLNGKAMGRYWELGPHHTVYLPEPSLEDANMLALLEEGGCSPRDTFLMRDANVPTVRVRV